MQEQTERKIKLNGPQCRFMPLKHKFRAFVGGFGSSKTYTGCISMCERFAEHPGVNQGYFAPTYPMIRDIFYPTIEEVAERHGLRLDIKTGTHEVHFFSGRQYRGTTICRSMDKPGNIIGFKIGNALIDELDTLPTNKAEEAWNKIIARLRYNVPGVKNGIDVATTPEGFRFCHKKFVQALQDNPELTKTHALVQASTYENAKHLPADYIPSLLESYPKELIEAYLMGRFVNLTSGTVFYAYNRNVHKSTEIIQEGEPLMIGQDFNVGKMASAVLVQRANGFHAVAELKDVFDTPALIKIVKERWQEKGHRIIVYPDASGGSRKTVDASKSDISLLTQAGFTVRANPSNPAVKDRVLATNKAFEVGKLWVNAKECPTLARCLEQQAYDDNGEPDKGSGFDHMCFTGDTIVKTSIGFCRIDSLPETGIIESFGGAMVPYINAGMTGKNREIVQVVFSDGLNVCCTLDHRFLTCNNWIKAIDLTGMYVYNNHKHSIKNGGGLWLRLLAKKGKNLMASRITCADSIFRTPVSGCIELFMSIIMEKYQRVAWFITRMVTPLIINPITSLYCKKANIPCTTLKTQEEKKSLNMQLNAPLRRLLNGTHPPKESNGISNNTKRQKTSYIILKHSIARIAENLLTLKTGLIKNISVPTPVVPPIEENRGKMMRQEIAQFVARNLKQTSIRKSNIVPMNAEQKPRGVQVISVMEAGSADVYCLTVPSTGCFALANGCIVSNCDAFSYPIAYEMPIIRPMSRLKIVGI